MNCLTLKNKDFKRLVRLFRLIWILGVIPAFCDVTLAETLFADARLEAVIREQLGGRDGPFPDSDLAAIHKQSSDR